ncbi:MAG TPA: NAD(P)/FAD-dependent oxidoreductase [Acidimicrobiales bacterium]|nr:NAD(P)/FAD-dependent oxidoreductase [Acidimicrobiales bacterium]
MDAQELEHVDVLIVGAGLSGIGAACHLRSECPDKSFALVEARSASGGTWDLFRYPGVRSDSDMFTLGYAFRPWQGQKAIADGPSILRYIRETAREHGIEQLIRYERRVVSAAWSSAEARWTVEMHRGDTNEPERLTCGFLYLNTGYYRYDEGYTPEFKGTDRFSGQIVHPQHWPDDLDYAGKRVVVIGSGATAVTLVPAMASTAAHVTMLQRSPTYILSVPESDVIADYLRHKLPARVAYPVVRWKNVLLGSLVFQLSRRAPQVMKRLIRQGVVKQLPAGYDVATHFSPPYQPWDQRLCLVPDGDLFKAISRGQVSVVTDTIETFTERGLQLESGAELEADVIVTATGLNMLLMGGINLSVDGGQIDLSETIGYKGTMFSGLPNLAATMGYTNASWTLKADLAAEYVCRLLRYMDDHGYRECRPRPPEAGSPTEPFIGLTSGYVLRSIDRLPRQGAKAPWRLYQNYPRDVLLLRHGAVEDEALEFSRAGSKVSFAR